MNPPGTASINCLYKLGKQNCGLNSINNNNNNDSSEGTTGTRSVSIVNGYICSK